MALTFHQILKRRKRITLQDLLDPEISRAIASDHERVVREREEAADRYFGGLGDLIEQRPPGHAGIRRR